MKLCRKSKVALIGVLAVVLILGAVLFVAIYFTLPKELTPDSANLAEVKLDEDETLTYGVQQNVEVHLRDLQKGAIHATVSIRAFNKTSEEYWFLMKFNLSQVAGNVDIGDFNIRTSYFLVRLQLNSRTTHHSNDGAGDSVALYGNYSTNAEQVRLVFGILEQLLPTVNRNLYEDVDGKKGADSETLHPEKSPLLPGSVKMHREANTSDKDTIVIKNHFNRSDFTNMSSEIDLDMQYSDFTSINKSNGMVIVSRSHFSTKLNFGEIINSNGSFNDTIMTVTLKRHVSLMETPNFDYSEIEAVNFNFFVKLEVSTTTTFSVNGTEKVPTNYTETPSNDSLSSQQHNSTNSSATSLKRVRRAEENNVVREIWKKTEPMYLGVEETYTLFTKKVLGINVKGTATFSVKFGKGGITEIGISAKLIIGGKKLPNVLSIKYSRSQLQGKGTRSGHQWKIKMSISVPVHALRLGVDFGLQVKVNIKLSFPPDGNSLNPVKLTVQIEPFAEVTASIEGYISAHAIRAGAYGEGTLMRVGLPVTLSYCDRRWCVTLSASLTALELNAGIFYQWWNVWKWKWGKRRTIHDFGKWAALKKKWKLLEKCTDPPQKTITPSIKAPTPTKESTKSTPTTATPTTLTTQTTATPTTLTTQTKATTTTLTTPTSVTTITITTTVTLTTTATLTTTTCTPTTAISTIKTTTLTTQTSPTTSLATTPTIATTPLSSPKTTITTTKVTPETTATATTDTTPTNTSQTTTTPSTEITLKTTTTATTEITPTNSFPTTTTPTTETTPTNISPTTTTSTAETAPTNTSTATTALTTEITPTTTTQTTETTATTTTQTTSLTKTTTTTQTTSTATTNTAPATSSPTTTTETTPTNTSPTTATPTTETTPATTSPTTATPTTKTTPTNTSPTTTIPTTETTPTNTSPTAATPTTKTTPTNTSPTTATPTAETTPATTSPTTATPTTKSTPANTSATTATPTTETTPLNTSFTTATPTTETTPTNASPATATPTIITTIVPLTTTTTVPTANSTSATETTSTTTTPTTSKTSTPSTPTTASTENTPTANTQTTTPATSTTPTTEPSSPLPEAITTIEMTLTANTTTTASITPTTTTATTPTTLSTATLPTTESTATIPTTIPGTTGNTPGTTTPKTNTESATDAPTNLPTFTPTFAMI